MNNQEAHILPQRPPRQEPPSGVKFYGALLGIALVAFVGCVLFTGAYLYFLEIRSLR